MKSPRGMIVFHPRKETPSTQIGNSITGTRKKTGGKRLRKVWNPSLSPGIPSFPGDREVVPEGHLSTLPARRVGLRRPTSSREHLVIGVTRLRLGRRSVNRLPVRVVAQRANALANGVVGRAWVLGREFESLTNLQNKPFLRKLLIFFPCRT